MPAAVGEACACKRTTVARKAETASFMVNMAFRELESRSPVELKVIGVDLLPLYRVYRWASDGSL